MSRVGIYGGTFDPIHAGHLHVITELIKRKIVDYLLIIPAGVPLLREGAPEASGSQRSAMCQLALSSLPNEFAAQVEVSPIEILRGGPSYAIDTVEAVIAAYPNDEIFLIVGGDAYANFSQWHRANELEKMVEILVINRPGYPQSGLDIQALDLAATDIRAGKSMDIPVSVATFIRENGLYASK